MEIDAGAQSLIAYLSTALEKQDILLFLTRRQQPK